MRRRDLLAGSALAAAGCSRSRRRTKDPVAVVRAPSYSGDLYDRVRRLIALHRLDVRAQRVLLKPNMVEFDARTCINTNPVLVHAVREALLAMGAAEVRIAEGPGHRRVTWELAEAAGYFASIPEFERNFTDLNLDEVTEVTLKTNHSGLNRLYLPNSVLRADLVVSLPKMKTHHWVGATLGMKNLFGIVPGAVYGWPKNVLHWAGIDACVADLSSLLPRMFTIVDGIVGMEGNGPIQGTPKSAGLLAAGADAAAVDATCCRLMGIDPAKVGYLKLAGIDVSEAALPQIGERPASLRTPFALIPELGHLRG